MAAAKLYNRIKVSTATTGTGTVTLGAASSAAFCTFAEAGVQSGDVVTYILEEGTNFEIGRGVYTSSGTTLSRDTVILSKISGTSGTSKMTLAGAATVRVTAAAEDFKNKNVLLNPDFRIDQRASGASTARSDDTYCLDRWYVLTQTASVNVSQQTDQENGTPYSIRLTQNQAAAQRMGLAQIVETRDCRHLRGETVTLSIRARISNAQAIRYAILGWTGTADTVTSDVVADWANATYTAGNFFLTSNLSVIAVGSQTPTANTWTTLSKLTGQVGSTENNIIVFVWTEGTAAQNVTLDLGYVQLEMGGVATDFERRHYEPELAACQRYFEVISAQNAGAAGYGVAQCASTSRAVLGIAFKTMKRVVPTTSLSAVSDWAFYNNTILSYVVWSSTWSATMSEWGGVLDVTTTTSGLGGAGDATMSTPNAATTAARIYLDAEL